VALDSFKFHVQRGHVRLHFSDGRGRDLEGHAVMPMVAFASDLIAEIARRKRGNLRGLSVDLNRGVLRATLDVACVDLDVAPSVDGGRNRGVEVVRIDGRDFESTVRPSSGPLIEWAEHRYGATSDSRGSTERS
jgi:hypothetical protein